jgi:hypothetical protein
MRKSDCVCLLLSRTAAGLEMYYERGEDRRRERLEIVRKQVCTDEEGREGGKRARLGGVSTRRGGRD